MAKPSQLTFESMARIGMSEKPYTDYLSAELSDVTDMMVSQVDETQLRILQGRAQQLRTLIELIRKAPECRKA